MRGGVPISARRRGLLSALVVALNVPLFVHLALPGLVGLTPNETAGAAPRAIAATRPTHRSDCTDVAGRASIREYLVGRVCAPQDFPYEPMLRRTAAGRPMVDPHGRCGSALGDTGRSFDFATACDGHDYGYDLLRFFGVGGAERRAVDAMFGAALWDSCRGRSFITRFNCYGWASTFDWVNRGNSLWRRYEAPRGPIGDNNVSDWSTKAAQVVLVTDAGLAMWLLRRRRRSRGERVDSAAVQHPVLVAGGR